MAVGGGGVTVRAAVFDLDGVLVSTDELHYRAWSVIARELGIAFTREQNDSLRGVGRMESLERLLAGASTPLRVSDREKAELARRKNELYASWLTGLRPSDLLPGAARLLADLRHREVPVAIASSSRNAPAIVQRLQLGPMVDAVVGGGEGASKPAPDLFLLAAGRLGVAPCACIAVEDADAGVRAALAAGMRVLAIGSPDGLAGAHAYAPDLRELTVERLLSV